MQEEILIFLKNFFELVICRFLCYGKEEKYCFAEVLL